TSPFSINPHSYPYAFFVLPLAHPDIDALPALGFDGLANLAALITLSNANPHLVPTGLLFFTLDASMHFFDGEFPELLIEHFIRCSRLATLPEVPSPPFVMLHRFSLPILCINIFSMANAHGSGNQPIILTVLPYFEAILFQYCVLFDIEFARFFVPFPT